MKSSAVRLIESAIAVAGLGILCLGMYLASVNLVIPYLFDILSTIMIHNTTVKEIISEYKKVPEKREHKTIRKSYKYLLIMLIVYWVITSVFLYFRMK